MVGRTELATHLGRSRSTSKSIASTFGPPSPHIGNIRSGEGGAEDGLLPPDGPGIQLPAARECIEERPTVARRVGHPARPAGRGARGRRPVSSNALLDAMRADAVILLGTTTPKGGPCVHDSNDPRDRGYRNRGLPLRVVRAGREGVEARLGDLAWGEASAADAWRER